MSDPTPNQPPTEVPAHTAPPDAPVETSLLPSGDAASAPTLHYDVGVKAPESITSPLADTPPELVDHPRYRVLQLLGKGGMGAVFLAEHLLMQRRVALKVISPSLLGNEDALARFRQEVRAVASLSHPNIVAAFDAEQAGSMHFLVMEFIDGVSLAQHVARNGPLPADEASAAIAQAALGLQHAFERGMIHRDIKPHNLMLTRDGQVKVLDFGLARLVREQTPQADGGLTATGVVMGTADYIAPEQARGTRTVDTRSDVYSLGCTFYHLLTGQVPFPEGTVIDKILRHTMEAPVPLAALRPELPAELIAVVERMMAKEPAQRFQTPAEVAEALAQFAGSARLLPATGALPVVKIAAKTDPLPPASSPAPATDVYLLQPEDEVPFDGGQETRSLHHSPYAVASLALGAAALLTAVSPCCFVGSLFSLPLSLAGLILGIFGLVRPATKERTALVMPAVGTAASALALIIVLLTQIVALMGRR